MKLKSKDIKGSVNREDVRKAVQNVQLERKIVEYIQKHYMSDFSKQTSIHDLEGWELIDLIKGFHNLNK